MRLGTITEVFDSVYPQRFVIVRSPDNKQHITQQRDMTSRSLDSKRRGGEKKERKGEEREITSLLSGSVSQRQTHVAAKQQEVKKPWTFPPV